MQWPQKIYIITIYYFHLSEAYTAYNYLQLQKGTTPGEIEKQLAPVNKNAGTQFTDYHLRPLTDIHLHSAVRGEISPNSDIRYIWFLSIIAVILIIIGGINFTSLATAKALQHYKEAGIRKVLGAQISDILSSFYKNYAILIGVACLIAIPLSYLFLRNWLNQFAFRIDMPVWIFMAAIAVTLFIAFAAVSYETVKAAFTNPVDSLISE